MEEDKKTGEEERNKQPHTDRSHGQPSSKPRETERSKEGGGGEKKKRKGEKKKKQQQQRETPSKKKGIEQKQTLQNRVAKTPLFREKEVNNVN